MGPSATVQPACGGSGGGGAAGQEQVRTVRAKRRPALPQHASPCRVSPARTPARCHCAHQEAQPRALELVGGLHKGALVLGEQVALGVKVGALLAGAAVEQLQQHTRGREGGRVTRAARRTAHAEVGVRTVPQAACTPAPQHQPPPLPAPLRPQGRRRECPACRCPTQARART